MGKGSVGAGGVTGSRERSSCTWSDRGENVAVGDSSRLMGLRAAAG